MSDPFRYKWDGSPYRAKVDPTRCAASVAESGRGVGVHQCGNKHKPDSEWCATHNPEAIAKRQAASADRYEKELSNSPYVRLGKAEAMVVDLKRELAEARDVLCECVPYLAIMSDTETRDLGQRLKAALGEEASK
jgi:hypothetical protein